MKKKLLLLIPVVFILIMVGLVMYLNPPTTPISISLDAVKIDRNCNELGTFAIDLTGEIIHPYFQEERLELTSPEFDRISSVRVLGNSSDFFPGAVPNQLPAVPFLRCFGLAYTAAFHNRSQLCEVVFSPDYERWMLGFRNDNVFYVGSTNSEDTVEQLHEYFLPMIIGSWSGDPYEKHQYFGRWVAADGTDMETVDLYLQVKVEQEDSRNVLTLYSEFPEDFPYTFTDGESYIDSSNGILPYYTTSGYTTNKSTGESEFFLLACDKEKGWSILVWTNNPTEYLIASSKPKFDSKEVLEHFNVFLDQFSHRE